MKVTYTDEGAFHRGVQFFVSKGMTFEACHNNLTITLTGGY